MILPANKYKSEQQQMQLLLSKFEFCCGICNALGGQTNWIAAALFVNFSALVFCGVYRENDGAHQGMREKMFNKTIWLGKFAIKGLNFQLWMLFFTKQNEFCCQKLYGKKRY